MRPFFRLLLGLTFLAAAFVGSAHAQGSAVSVVTYVDVMPSASDAGAVLLKSYRDGARKENGNLRSDLLQEIGRPNRFVIVDVWKDKAAFDAHGKAAGTAQFRDKLKNIQNAPPDERVTSSIYSGEAASQHRGSPIYVVTHVDVIPPGKDDCMAGLKAMSGDTPKDPGYLGYEVLQQANRSNHFTVLEIWANKKSLDGHAMAAHTRAFREKLSPLGGALYDERYYKAVG